jgi:hypothetical protein
MELMSNGQWKPNMIIRVGKGSEIPLNPGPQHRNNYFKEFQSITQTIKFFDCLTADDVKNAYDHAINEGGITLINEYPEKYNS